MFGPRQLALSVEIENQISLCLEPTGIELVTSTCSFNQRLTTEHFRV